MTMQCTVPLTLISPTHNTQIHHCGPTLLLCEQEINFFCVKHDKSKVYLVQQLVYYNQYRKSYLKMGYCIADFVTREWITINVRGWKVGGSWCTVAKHLVKLPPVRTCKIDHVPTDPIALPSQGLSSVMWLALTR